MLSMFAGAQVVHQYYLPDLVSVIFCAFSFVIGIADTKGLCRPYRVNNIVFTVEIINKAKENMLCINKCIFS